MNPQPGFGALLALLVFVLASIYIGILANRAVSKGSFLKGFFLGNRGLGAWTLALTATVQSGGTFMGFPSLAYSHGWVVALWIAGYMVVPITGFGVLAKRMAQISRRTGAITVPDLFRARFDSPRLGLIASLLILFYMSFMMVAQFKAGAIVMKLAWPGSGTLALSEDFTSFKITDEHIAEAAKEYDENDVSALMQPLVGQVYADREDLEAAIDAALIDITDEVDRNKVKTKLIAVSSPLDYAFLFGLGIFTVTVVGYTMLGGFLAAVWTDLFQSIMMFFGVMFLLVLSLNAAGGMEAANREAVSRFGVEIATGPGFDPTGTGRPYLPLSLAFSMFFIWVFAGMGSPASVVRVMASENTDVIRRSIYLLSLYNACIYIPLIMICMCGRALLPALPAGQSDEIIPLMALHMTKDLPVSSFLAGLILAAPFGAVMATVSSYLVVIASGLVRDVYQRFINPQATQQEMKRLSYFVMILVGAIAVIANLEPPPYLQAVVVFSGSSAAATFCIPSLMVAFWRRATKQGAMAGMLGGAATMLALYILGFNDFGGDPGFGPAKGLRPYYLANLDPIIWGLGVSLISSVIVSLLTEPPPREVVSPLFDAQPQPPANASNQT
ncbi:MAG: sodium:solute symporter [Planctomycetaceae bacterium]